MEEFTIQEGLRLAITVFLYGIADVTALWSDKGELIRVPIAALKKALVDARDYNRDPVDPRAEINKSTDIEACGVASNPIELDKLSTALQDFCNQVFRNLDLQHRHRRRWPGYDKHIYPLYDLIMLAKRRLAADALCEQDTAVGRCLARLVNNRLAGTTKGNLLLAEVMTILIKQEKDQRDYMMSVLEEKSQDGNGKSILDNIKEQNKRIYGETLSPEHYQKTIDCKIYELQNKEPHKTELANIRRESMRGWLSENKLKDIMKDHRYPVSFYKDTYSIRCLKVAEISDLIRDKQAIYGRAFFAAYDTLSPSSNKAFLVATALDSMEIKTKDDFIKALQGNNALTKALKMRCPGMSLLFGSSKTWQSVQDIVLKDLKDPNEMTPPSDLKF